jgi:hypothetical protein
VSRLGHLTPPGNRPLSHTTENWLSLRARLDTLEYRKTLVFAGDQLQFLVLLSHNVVSIPNTLLRLPALSDKLPLNE